MTSAAAKPGAALLGITHPHTSGRTRALIERSIPILGAWDDDPVLEPFTKKFEIRNRPLDAILDDPEVSIVLIHSKSHSMAPLASAALRAGKAVLVEKPGGKSLADLEALARVVEETNGVCQVGYSYRFSQAVRITEEVLETGILGQIHQVRAHGGCSLSEAATSHLNQPDDIGGAFFVIGCHLVDLLIHHLGMPASVNAKIPKFAGLFGPGSREDAGIALFEYPNKIVSFDFSSWDPLPWVESWDVSFYGNDGVLHARPLPATCELFLKEAKGRFNAGWTRWNETSFPIAWASEKTEYTPELAEIGNLHFFRREVESFVAAALGERPVEIPAAHARDILKLITACYESSAQGGQEVRLNKNHVLTKSP
jgi:predicted dehydrogenase